MQAPVEAEAQDAASETVMPGREDFFDRYRSLLPQQEFNKFHEVVSRERHSKGFRFERAGLEPFRLDDYWSSESVNTMMEEVSQLDTDNVLDVQNVFIIQDVDIRCLMGLSATYNLDPHFLVSYVALGEPSRWPKSTFHKATTGVAGSWYTTTGATSGFFTQDEETSNHSSRSTWNRACKLWGSSKSPTSRAWWQEDHRRWSSCTVSMTGCYCLTSTLRRLQQRTNSMFISNS